MTARPHEALRRERSLARGAVSAEAQQEDNEAEDSEDANAAGRREASCDTADARPTAEPRDERSEVEGSRNFKDRERRGQLGKGSGELSLRRESEKRSGGSMEPSGGKARRARERERRKTRDRGRKRKVASSPLERRRAPPVLYSTQGLSTATATRRIIEAVEALVREFRGADRGLGGKRGPRASAPAGSCGGRWGASLARVVSALPAAETGIAVCALTASAAMTLVCILLKHSHGATVSLARFVFFLPLVVLAAWLAYRSRTIEHLRAVSKLQEALDDFKQQTGFACLSAMPWSATLCSPPPISLAAPQAFSPSSSSALSGLGARGLRCPKGLPFAAPSAAPAAQAHARPQDVVTCSASGLGGAHEPDYARLSPAQIFAGLRELVADPDAGPLRGARLGADAAAAQAGAFAASARGFSRAASFGGARDADAAEAAQRPVPEGDRHRQAGEEEARVLHESPLPAASLVAVLRDAQWTTIPRNMLAAGDIFKLRAGDPLPCDAVRVVPSFLVSRRRSRRRPAVRPSSSSPPRCGSPSSPRKKSPKGEHPAREGKSVSQPAASPSALHSPSASRADDAKATPRRRASFASAAGSPEGPPRRRSRRESLSFRGRKSGAAPGLEAANGDAGGAAWAPSRRRPSSLPPPSLSSSSASSPARAAPPRPPKLVLRPLLARGVYRAGAVFSPVSRSPPPPFSPAASTEGLDFSGSMRSPPSASPTRLGAPASPAASPSVAPSGGDGCADDATPRARSAGSSPTSPFFALKASMFLSRPRRAELAVLRLRSRGASAALATDAAAGEPAACVGGAPCRRASPSRRRAREAPEEGLDEELRRQTRSKRRERLEVETGEDGDVARVLRHARGHRRDRRRRGDKEEARLRRAERERRRAVSRETDGKGEGRRKREKESRRRARAAPSSRARARRSGRGEDTLSDHGRRRLAVPHAWTNDGREDSRGLHRRAEASASRGRFSRVVADAYGPRGREAAPKHRDLWMDLAQHETQCPRRADSRLRGEALHSRPPPDVPSSDAVVAAAESDPEAPESSSCGDRQRISPLRGRHRQRPFVSPHSPPPPTPPSASACAAPGACSPAFPPLSPESSSAFLRAPFDFYSAVPPCPPGASSGSQSPAATSPRSRDARLQTFRLMRLFASSPSLAAARPLDSNAEEEAALLATAAAEAAQGAGDADREGDASDRDEAFEDASDSEFIEVCQVAPELASATFVALRTSCVGTLRTFLEASLRNPDSSRSRAKVPFFDTADLVSRRVALVWFIACAVCICAVIFWDVVGSSGAESIPVGLRIARWHLPINVTVCMLMAWPRILGELTDIWGNARLQSLFQEAHFRARQDACVDVEGEGRKCRSISSSSWTSDTSSNASPVSSTVSVSNVPLSKQIKELIYIFKRGLDGSSNLLHIMNSTTVLCFVDKDGILVDACRTIQEIAIGATTHAGGGGVSEPLPCLSPGRRPSLACRGAPRDRDAEAEAEAEVETRGDAQNSLQPSPSLLSDAPPDVALDADFAFSFHAEDAVRAAFRASSPSAPSHSDAEASRSPAVETPRRERPRSSAISRRSEALGAAKPRVEGDDDPAQGLAWVGAHPAPGRVAGGDRTVASPSARPSTCAAGAEENKGGGAGADADEPGGEGRSASPRRRFFRPLLLGKRGRGDAGRRGALPVLSPASYRGHAEGEVLSPSSAFSPEASPSCSSPPRLPSSPAPSSLTASLSSPNTSRGQKHWRARGKREEASGRRYDERDADDGAAAESAEEARAMQQRRRRRASSDDGRPWLVGERAEREERREDESEEERGCVLDEEFFALGDAFVAFDIGHDEEGREEALQEAEEALREAEALREEAFREEEEEEALREEEEAFREEEEALREEEEDEALRDEEEAFREEEEALREEEEEALRDEEAALTEEDEVYGRDQRGDDAEIEREEDTRPVTEFRKIVLDLMNDDECDAGLRFENDSWIEYTTQIKPLALAMALTQLPRPIRKSFADPSWLFALYVQDLFLPHPDRQVAHAELLDCQCSLARIVGMPEIFFQNFLPLRFALAVQPSPPQRPAPAPGRASLSSRLSPPSPPSPRSASARRAPPSAFSLLCGLRKRKPEYLAAQRLREEPQPPASEEENAGSQGDDEGSRGEDARDDSDAELTPEAHAVASEACAVAGGGVRAACGGAESAVEKLRRRRASRNLGIRRVTWADGPRRQNESSRRHSSPKDTCEAETDADDELDAGGAGRPRTPTSRSRSSPAFQPSPVCAARLPWPLSPSRSVSGRRRSILDAPEVPVLAHEVRDRVRLLADSAADVPAPCFRVLASHAAESRDARGSPASLTDDAETERDEEDAGRDECSRSDVRQTFAREKEDVVSTSRAADTSGSVLMLWVVRDAASKVVHLFVKGAPALLLPRVKFYLDGQHLLPFDSGAAHSLLELNNQWLSTGLDAVAFGYRPLQLEQETALLSLLKEQSVFSICQESSLAPALSLDLSTSSQLLRDASCDPASDEAAESAAARDRRANAEDARSEALGSGAAVEAGERWISIRCHIGERSAVGALALLPRLAASLSPRHSHSHGGRASRDACLRPAVGRASPGAGGGSASMRAAATARQRRWRPPETASSAARLPRRRFAMTKRT
ncbi:hypothetical protein BESB_059170 [Besnoitia besnoiti]|uniref:Transmembrane protein n=1 Tax=Besnoitia besnoiti TaxID=94643 RepID=A0A2A9MI03_BESBE|nr:hypothetical protein BESB_059170 [Besnoitia besnoiti]PFH35030.1 hypothetical protein BESB_059170 [Besnoitia besnoiti]